MRPWPRELGQLGVQSVSTTIFHVATETFAADRTLSACRRLGLRERFVTGNPRRGRSQRLRA